MHLTLMAVGTRMPKWVAAGVQEYQPRLPKAWRFRVVEIPPGTRSRGSDAARAIAAEGQRMLKQIPAGAEVIALDERGSALHTAQWSAEIGRWQGAGKDVVMLVGGADGLASECLQRANAKWSLSALTLPHGLVRVMVVEQLYRAASLLEGHPYHRDRVAT